MITKSRLLPLYFSVHSKTSATLFWPGILQPFSLHLVSDDSVSGHMERVHVARSPHIYLCGFGAKGYLMFSGD